MSKERQTVLDCFKTRYIAHRGLFNNKKDAPENTILAFMRAVEAGYGIELDVQICKDKQIVVAHDYSLKRICGVDKEIKDLTYQELSQYKIFNSNEKIPLLSKTLSAINGKVPLIVEIKTELSHEEVCVLTAEALSTYSGVYSIESFSPFAVGWLKRNHPEIIRGQLADNFMVNKYSNSSIENWMLTNMIYNVKNKPDYIAYNHEFGDKKCLWFWKKILGCSLCAWTVTSQAELDRAAKIFDILIFDSFIPN